MPKLPRISGDEAIKVFETIGFKIVRQKGSHVVLRRNETGCVIPVHKILAIGTLRSAIRQAGITPEEFISSYESR